MLNTLILRLLESHWLSLNQRDFCTEGLDFIIIKYIYYCLFLTVVQQQDLFVASMERTMIPVLTNIQSSRASIVF